MFDRLYDNLKAKINVFVKFFLPSKGPFGSHSIQKFFSSKNIDINLWISKLSSALFCGFLAHCDAAIKWIDQQRWQWHASSWWWGRMDQWSQAKEPISKIISLLFDNNKTTLSADVVVLNAAVSAAGHSSMANYMYNSITNKGSFIHYYGYNVPTYHLHCTC